MLSNGIRRPAYSTGARLQGMTSVLLFTASTAARIFRHDVPVLWVALAVLLFAAAMSSHAEDVSAGRSFALVVGDWQRTFDSIERSLNDQQLDEARRRR